ncbi:MAG: hypothetical protein CME69_12310 [Halobacteriovorax sp.]|nr:hypothetical protein [Halobacteriovorax sp.]
MTTQSNIENYCLTPGMFRLDGGAMYGIIPRPLWQKKSPPDDLNRINLDLRLWLIKSSTKVILTDTGIGDYHGQKFDEQFDVRQSQNPIEQMLSNIGLKTSDVTDLVISHLHFDHVGGICAKEGENLVNVFKNATIHLHQSHYEYSLNPTLRDSGSFHSKIFNPIIKEAINNERVNFLTEDQGVVLEIDKDHHLFYKVSHGHTPYLMHTYTDKYIYLADLIPTSNHIHIPWVMGYDISPGLTTEYKIEFLDFIIENDLTVIFEHDPVYWGAKIKKDERGKYIAKELYEKSDLEKNKGLL